MGKELVLSEHRINLSGPLIIILITSCVHNTSAPRISCQPRELKADGIQVCTCKVEPCSPEYKWSYVQDSINLHLITQAPCHTVWRTGVFPGSVQIKARKGNLHDSALLKLEPCLDDKDHDGFPDVTELNDGNDRERFRDWFIWLALALKDSILSDWNSSERDCAGLLRYCYREALKSHDYFWKTKWSYMNSILPMPDRNVQKYSYPRIPLLSDKLFRTRAGEFYCSDLEDTTFAQFAKARHIMDYCCDYLGKSSSTYLKPGDLLFFHRPEDLEDAYHSMIYLGGKDKWIIYHTGTDSIGIRQVTLDQLRTHPNPIWHPVALNHAFQGYFRWKILE